MSLKINRRPKDDDSDDENPYRRPIGITSTAITTTQNEPTETKETESKEIEIKKPERKPKPEPGNGLPKTPPSFIQFTWNLDTKSKADCDTLHLLYLLQLALNLVRLRTIERNKYFKSIGRTDRYINHLDNPLIITNFIRWHKLDPENNKFDGEMLDKKEKLFMINQMISEIGIFSMFFVNNI